MSSAAIMPRAEDQINQAIARRRRNAARRNYQERQAILEQMTDEAFDVLRELLSSPNDSIRLAAAKETLDRSQGKARQMQQIDVRATDMTALHLAALRALANDTQVIESKAKAVIDHAS